MSDYSNVGTDGLKLNKCINVSEVEAGSDEEEVVTMESSDLEKPKQIKL